MNEQRLEELFSRYINRTSNEAEVKELMQLLSEPELEEKKEAMIEAVYDQMPSTYMMTEIQAENIFTNILKQKQSGEHASTLRKKTPGQVRGMLFKRCAVAASIILALGIGSYFLFFTKTGKKNEIVKTTEPAKDVEAPKETKAMITFADGSTVSLDSVISGTLATQGNVKVTKTVDGHIIYNGSSTEIEYNTLFNPRGSKVVPLTLNDGTKVWLNSESSLKYPTAFAGNERKVEIKGEAYFEVAKDAPNPFKVLVNGTEIEVLGTHFNVNAYENEATMRTTLLEGSVKINKEGNSYLLKPGQQAQVKAGGEIRVVSNINVSEVVAWKNGDFQFENTDIETIMRQVARWYDVDVVYEGKINQRFHGKIPRKLNVSEMFKILESTGWVQFKIDGKTITVKP